MKRNIERFIENCHYKINKYKRPLSLIVFVIFIFATLFFLKYVYNYLYSLVFYYPIDKVSQYNLTNMTQNAILENQYRATSVQLVATVGQIFGGIVILIGTYVAWGNLTVAREGQITERFTRAVDQLGNQAQEIRLGGVHALGRISRESKKDYSTIMTILTDYVRINSNIYNHSENKHPKYESFSMDILANKTTTSGILDGIISTDIQAALKVIGERKSFFNGKDKHLDLRETFLRGADLSDLHLEGAYLSWANLEKAMLFGTHLNDAYLRGTNLKFAKLNTAELRGAHLEQADLSRANLTLAHLEEANLEEAILKYTILEAAHLEKANLKGTNLEKAILVITHLEGAMLDGANLRGAILRLTHLQGAQLGGANLEGAYLGGAFLEKAFFGKANLKGADLSDADLKEAILGSTNLENAKLWHANLEKANLLDAKICKADLLGVNLKGAFLYKADLRGAKLLGVDLEEAHLTEANLEGADLQAVNLKEASLDRANLSGVNFENARLDNADLKGADLRKARNLSIDQLSKVKSLDGAKIDENLRRSLEEKDPEKYQTLIKKPSYYNYE